MYSDRNFNIRSEWVEALVAEPAHEAPAGPSFWGAIAWIVQAIFWIWAAAWAALVVAFLIALAWSITSLLQPQTRKECIQCQSSESPKSQRSRETNSSSPNPRTNRNPIQRSERSSPKQSGSNLVGATAPSFRWVCREGQMLCGLKDANGKYVQSFSLENGSISSSPIFPDAMRPKAWACERNDGKLYCNIQDGQGHILQGFIYDGHTFN